MVMKNWPRSGALGDVGPGHSTVRFATLGSVAPSRVADWRALGAAPALPCPPAGDPVQI